MHIQNMIFQGPPFLYLKDHQSTLLKHKKTGAVFDKALSNRDEDLWSQFWALYDPSEIRNEDR
jgi:hypothetical protein